MPLTHSIESPGKGRIVLAAVSAGEIDGGVKVYLKSDVDALLNMIASKSISTEELNTLRESRKKSLADMWREMSPKDRADATRQIAAGMREII